MAVTDAYLPVHPLSRSLSLSLSVSVCLCLSVCLAGWLSVWLSGCLSVWLSVPVRVACKDAAMAVTDAYLPVIKNHKEQEFTPEEKEWQLIRRCALRPMHTLPPYAHLLCTPYIPMHTLPPPYMHTSLCTPSHLPMHTLPDTAPTTLRTPYRTPASLRTPYHLPTHTVPFTAPGDAHPTNFLRTPSPACPRPSAAHPTGTDGEGSAGGGTRSSTWCTTAAQSLGSRPAAALRASS
eukprot:1295096-Rhodomonas_salina.1